MLPTTTLLMPTSPTPAVKRLTAARSVHSSVLMETTSHLRMFSVTDENSLSLTSRVIISNLKRKKLMPQFLKLTTLIGTPISCIPPPDTQCGNLIEMPFAPFILDSKLVFLCEEKKVKGGYVEQCTFRCVDDPAQKPLMLSDPSSLNPLHVATNPGPIDICEVKVSLKAKDV